LCSNLSSLFPLSCSSFLLFIVQSSSFERSVFFLFEDHLFLPFSFRIRRFFYRLLFIQVPSSSFPPLSLLPPPSRPPSPLSSPSCPPITLSPRPSPPLPIHTPIPSSPPPTLPLTPSSPFSHLPLLSLLSILSSLPFYPPLIFFSRSSPILSIPLLPHFLLTPSPHPPPFLHPFIPFLICFFFLFFGRFAFPTVLPPLLSLPPFLFHFSPFLYTLSYSTHIPPSPHPHPLPSHFSPPLLIPSCFFLYLPFFPLSLIPPFPAPLPLTSFRSFLFNVFPLFLGPLSVAFWGIRFPNARLLTAFFPCSNPAPPCFRPFLFRQPALLQERLSASTIFL